MKNLLASLAFVAIPAAAQTINLEPGANCNAYCSCLSVPTDVGIELNYVTPTSVSLEPGVVFTGPATYPSQMFDGAGHMLTVTLQFTRWTTKTVSGRGAGARIQHCALVGGSIQ